MHYDLAICGTGLFGAVVANEAMKKGKKVILIDKRSHIGGNIYTEKKDNIDIHKYGAHIFHTSDKRIWDYINSFATFNNFINSPIANYKGKLYPMPFNMNTFYAMWGTVTPEEAEKKINEEKSEIKGTPNNLEEQAISLVGRTIYETLVKGYTEKQWGRDAKELPPEIIKRLPVRLTFNNNYFSDKYQGIPENGYTGIIEKMLSGADIVLNTNFLDEKDKWKQNADLILYTGCLDAYFNYSEGKLQYRSEIFEEIKLEEENHQGVAVMNYTDRETPWTRIIEHKHFTGASSPVTWISREYPVDYEKTGEPFYPINDEANTAIYAKYRKLADNEKNLVVGGRLAEYRYYDMDKTIAAALVTAKRIL